MKAPVVILMEKWLKDIAQAKDKILRVPQDDS
jgi:hypothetical protein